MPTNTPAPSFIPHEAPTVGAIPRGGRGLADLLMLLALVLFVASVALAIGVFLYAGFLESSAASKVDQLKIAKAAFEPSLIHELTRLEDRMKASGEVLGAHIAPSAFFNMLEQATIQTVSFSSLDLETDAGHMKVQMDGVAASVNSIALQADLFSKGGMVTSPIFSDIDREADGVHFSLSALVDPAAINFVQIFNAAAASTQQQSTPFSAPQEGAGEVQID